MCLNFPFVSNNVPRTQSPLHKQRRLSLLSHVFSTDVNRPGCNNNYNNNNNNNNNNKNKNDYSNNYKLMMMRVITILTLSSS